MEDFIKLLRKEAAKARALLRASKVDLEAYKRVKLMKVKP